MKRDIVVIGASAGGIEAIAKLLRDLPPDLPASLFVVLHINAAMVSHLPQIWNRTSSLPVIKAEDGDRIESARVYVAAPDHHLLCEDGKVAVSKGPKENRQRPSIDTLFRSAAYSFGPRVIGIVLTGMLDDGTAGLWHIKRQGGLALVQSPEDAQCPSMPLSAIRNVKIDYILPVAEIGRVTAALCKGELLVKSEPIIDSSLGEQS